MVAFDPLDPPFDRLGPERLERVFSLWHHWRGDKPAPRRAEVDPAALRALLPQIFILDVEEDDFRFRLVGEAVNERYDHRLKGHSLRDLLNGAVLDETLHEHRQCVERLQAVLVHNGLDTASHDDRSIYTRLLLPLEVVGGTARHILGMMEFPAAA
ncbi:PAS domain-containing protein [Radicibacter daui]|uniref:PAS domain-containing protein n=1 Tax=Radicibacter daui TaxID=3064829 RepID=UPI004046BF26